MYKVSNKIILLIISLALMSGGCNQKTEPPYSTALEVGGKKIFVEIVNTLEKMQQGLSGREKLDDGQGMLFDFSGLPEKRPGFWMKDMKFDLDLIWIKNNPSTPSTDAQGRPEETRGATSSGRIVGITPNVSRPKSVDDKLPSYYPPDDIDQVLEVVAGWSEKYKIKVGDRIIK